jgi:hydrogenase nickel incorporation protein HypB
MCETCGCGQPDHPVTITKLNTASPATKVVVADHSHHEPPGTSRQIAVHQDLLAKNDELATHNREHLESREILAINLLSSPGAGKTTLLEKTIAHLNQDLPITVIEGDQQTLQDARRIQASGAQALQINTGTGCHLDAHMIHEALHQLNPPRGSLLFIENVGNLVCPALFDLGEAEKVVIVSVTEGTDKPLKYDTIFAAAQTCIINKIDLLPYVDFDETQFQKYARSINPQLHFLHLSAQTEVGLDTWLDYLTTRHQADTAT